MNNKVSKDETDKILRYHVWASMGVSLIPLPFLDFAALSVVQFNMLRKLSKLYGVPMIRKTEKNLRSWALTLGSFADDAAFAVIRKSVLPTVSASMAASMTKAVPVSGQAIGVVSAPIINGAFTYALGKVFVLYFETDGNIMTLDPEKVKAYYAEMFDEGKKVAAEIKKEKK